MIIRSCPHLPSFLCTVLDCSSLEEDDSLALALVPSSSNGGTEGGHADFLSSVGCRLDLLEPTHRGLHRFVPRHSDEVEVEIGDPVSQV